jgi:hypothetical protein
MTMHITDKHQSSGAGSLLIAFEPEEPGDPETEELFCGAATFRVQAPDIRNDYKKRSGSSDGGKTYDTTAV